jgi:hypothetical protein
MTYATEMDSEEALRREIVTEGLRVEDIYQLLPEEAPARRLVLADLVHWVRAWRLCPDRAAMERMGFQFPPVDPDIDPETDWLRFERWMKGEPLNWRYEDEYGSLRDPEMLSDAELAAELDRVLGCLASRQVWVDIPEAVPDRPLYEYLFRELKSGSLEICAPGTNTHLTGCAGDCVNCFQQRWCDIQGEEVKRAC